jgi:hypothetical protein
MQLDPDQVQLITEGWITKQSRWVKAWRKRYAFLYDTVLYVSTSRDASNPRHVLDLMEFVHVKPADELLKKKSSFMIGCNNGNKYYFHCENDEQRNHWIKRISAVLNDPPRRMTADQLKDKPCLVRDDLQFYLVSNQSKKIEIKDLTTQQKILLRNPENRNQPFKVSSASPGFLLVSLKKENGNLIFIGPEGVFGSASKS